MEISRGSVAVETAATQTKSAIAIFNALVHEGGLRLDSHEFSSQVRSPIAIEGLVRTGCRGGTPGWGQSPHTLLP
jgi:hypothetical protein